MGLFNGFFTIGCYSHHLVTHGLEAFCGAHGLHHFIFHQKNFCQYVTPQFSVVIIIPMSNWFLRLIKMMMAVKNPS